ncbi:MAG: SBBP repeat-containing protein, partial [Armatimonadota bacterium]|nr:SBBP repeat-containing protein [Armatimonadota bacterium]
MKHPNVWLSTLLTAALMVAGLPANADPVPPSSQTTLHKIRAAANYGRIPLHFEANRGQCDKSVKFVSRGRGYNLLLGDSEAVLSLRSTPLRLRLIGAHAQPRVTGQQMLPGKVNYLFGNDPSRWRTNVPTYARVHYANVYPGVDLVYYGNQQQLEYDFVVAPGADPRVIRMQFQGARQITLNQKGDLILRLAQGEVVQHAPIIYQNVKGRRQRIAGRYVIQATHQVGFHVGRYDRTRPLFIDPVLVYSTFLGGSDSDSGNGIDVDSNGNAYIVGTTRSTDLATATGVAQPGFGGSLLFKTTTAGAAWRAAETGLPKTRFLEIHALAVNPVTTAIIYAGTNSQGVFKSVNGGASWTAANTGLPAQTPINALAIDPKTPTTVYAGTDFQGVFKSTDSGASWTAINTGLTNLSVNTLAINPVTPTIIYAGTDGGLFKSVNGGANWSAANTGLPSVAQVQTIVIDPKTPTTLYAGLGSTSQAFSRFNGIFKSVNSGASWSEMNNGVNDITPRMLAIDPQNPTILYAAMVFGFGVYKTTNGGGDWGQVLNFVRATSVVVDPINPATVYVGSEQATGDPVNGVYKTTNGGTNWSKTGLSGTDVLALAIDPKAPSILYAGSKRLSHDTFVAKLNAAGTAFTYLTYLGGTGEDEGLGIAVDGAGNAYITGSTTSSDFPTTANAFSRALRTNPDFPQFTAPDAFVTKLNATGSALLYSTYLGSIHVDSGRGIAVDTSGHAYVGGETGASSFRPAEQRFPTTSNAFQTEPGSGTGFISKINPSQSG